ncbi:MULTISPECIES: hypothetical protein [Pseudomonadati]|uniref:hypothetical protein n=1 Tax=unclassified Halobacteriovorax TaxID=2639665 RepID=UPI0011AEC7BD|nr:hypothetical protein [Halobacteriovorax sp. DA5]
MLVSNGNASELYAGGGASLSGVISESDYYNGATAIFPSANVGVKFGALAIEGFFRKGTLSNDHQGFKIDLDTNQFGFMLRLSPEEWLDMNLGGHWTMVEGSSSVYNGQVLTGLVNRTYSSVILGMGFNIPLSNQLRVRTDMNFYSGKEIFSLFQFDISVVYSFLTF